MGYICRIDIPFTDNDIILCCLGQGTRVYQIKYFVYCHDIHPSKNQELEKTYEEKNILGVFQFWNYVTVDGKTYQTVAFKHLKMW